MSHVVAGALINLSTAETLYSGKRLAGFDTLLQLKSLMEQEDWIPQGDLEDFRRGSDSVKLGQLCALLAASEFGGNTEKTAIVGWNGNGCSANNALYWRDYVENGRELGRSALFVATLPTTPICEAAITLGIKGSVFYLKTIPSTGVLLDELEGLFQRANIDRILVLEIIDGEACALLLESGSSVPETENLRQLFDIMKQGK